MWAKRRQFCAVDQLAEQLNAVFAAENGVGRGCSRWQAAGGHANAERWEGIGSGVAAVLRIQPQGWELAVVHAAR